MALLLTVVGCGRMTGGAGAELSLPLSAAAAGPSSPRLTTSLTIEPPTTVTEVPEAPSLRPSAPTARRSTTPPRTRRAAGGVAPPTTPTGRSQPACHPNYGGCVPISSDVDCAGGTGDGPEFVRGPLPVLAEDVYDLDRNGDGTACEADPPWTSPSPTDPICHPNYGGCVPIASDVDCAGGRGNGPEFVRGPLPVLGEDVYDLDRDDDVIACEKERPSPTPPSPTPPTSTKPPPSSPEPPTSPSIATSPTTSS